MSVTAAKHYRIALPDVCIEFASKQGRQMFKDSMRDGFSEIYFLLASNFRTLEAARFSGPSSIVLILNALDNSPSNQWIAPWRFYHEAMLDCCTPLEGVKKSGLNIEQFANLAKCNRLDAKLSYANDTPAFLLQFRASVMASVKSDDSVVVVSFDRTAIDQIGAGVFSPIASYNRETDCVLLMEVVRFSYAPYWIPLIELQRAMMAIDRTTKKQRGYVTVKLMKDTRPLVMFGIKSNISINDGTFASSVKSWRDFLLGEPLQNPNEELFLCCRRFAQYFGSHALCCTQKQLQNELDKQIHGSLVEAHSEACNIVCSEVRSTRVSHVFQNGAVAALMLAWPYEPDESRRHLMLYTMVEADKKEFSQDTKNEIDRLHDQLDILTVCSRPPPRLDRGYSDSNQPTQPVKKISVCSCRSTDVWL